MDGITDSMDMSLSNLQEVVKISLGNLWEVVKIEKPGVLKFMGSQRVGYD